MTPTARQRLLKLAQPGKALNKTVLYQYTASEEDVSVTNTDYGSLCANLVSVGRMGDKDKSYCRRLFATRH